MQKFSLDDAISAHLSGNFDKARVMYAAIIAQYPEAALPFFYMASLCAQQDDLVGAMVYLERCVQLEEIPAAYNNLGTIYRRLNKQELAKKALLKGLEKPEDLEADLLNNIGTVYINEGSPEDGKPYLRRAIEISPNHIQANWNLGLLLLEQREWKEGWEQYHWGSVAEDRMNRWETWPQWKGERSRTIIYGEQGLGDEIMFASILPDAARDTDVIYECHPRLENVFKRTFDFPIYPTRKQMHDLPDFPDFDTHCAIGDLGMLYRNSDESFPKEPYLKLDSKKMDSVVQGYKRYPKPWIGIGWKGGKFKTRRELRSLPLDDWLPILQQDGTFFSFQYEKEADEEVDRFCKAHPEINLYHFPSIARADDYDIVLHHLNAMDCVVHVNGSAVHACGAIGQPCYTLTPSKPAWRYSIFGEDMPFYGSNVVQIRQDGQNWESVIGQAAYKIAEKKFPPRLSLRGDE